MTSAKKQNKFGAGIICVCYVMNKNKPVPVFKRNKKTQGSQK